MIGGLQLSAIEEKLAVAMSDSLRVVALDRPKFIAMQLLGELEPGTGCRLQQSQPTNLVAEIAQLTTSIKMAVNTAARHNDEPLRRIADSLLRSVGAAHPGLNSITVADVQEQKMAAAKVAEEAVDNRTPSATRTANDNSAAGISSISANPLQRVLDQREQSRRDEDTTRAMPKLGSRPSQILPTVIGTFQEAAAKKQAREVDDDLIAEAMAAGMAHQGMGADSTKNLLG